MKVAQIMAGAPAGGAELFFERLSIALHRAGDAVLPVIRRDAARAGRLAAAGLAPLQLGFGGPLDLLTGPRLRALLRRFAPRVVVAWMNRAARFAPRGDWVLAGRLGGYYDLSLLPPLRPSGRQHARASWTGSRARAGRPSGCITCRISPTDLAGAAPASRPSLGVPDGARLVLALGRLHRNKAFDVLVRALPRLPGVHAVIAGEGPERAERSDLARREGVADRLHLPGWRDDTGAPARRGRFAGLPAPATSRWATW